MLEAALLDVASSEHSADFADCNSANRSADHDDRGSLLQQVFERLQEDLPTRRPSTIPGKNLCAITPICNSSSYLESPGSINRGRPRPGSFSSESSNRPTGFTLAVPSDASGHSRLLNSETRMMDLNIQPIRKYYWFSACLAYLVGLNWGLLFRGLICFLLWLGSAIVFYIYQDNFK